MSSPPAERAPRRRALISWCLFDWANSPFPTVVITFVFASDAFFPFADGLLAAAEAGATAVIQPGGSVRDAEVIAAADTHGLAMVFTGTRHFRH